MRAGLFGVLALFGWFLFLRPGFLGGPAGYIIVSGPSMEPTLYEKDLAVVLAQDEYALGDVVAFRVEGGIVIHRIVGGDPQAGYITRGDNRESPDMWRPKPADIVGRLVLRLPGAGRWLEWLREPPAFSALASGLAAASLATAEPRPPRRRGGRRAGPGPVRPLPDLAWGVLIVAGLGVLAFGALAFFAFRQPLREQVPVERARYEHSAAFSYVVQVQPSFLYPEGIFGPVRPTPGARPPAVLPPSPFGNRPQPPSGAAVFTRLARRLELDVDYALRSDLPAELTGRYWAVVEVGSGAQGWVRTLEAVPPTEFQGGAASFKVSVDFGQIWSVIDAVERETEYRPGSYEVRVVPTIQVSGRVGSEPVDDTFSPPFTLRLDRARIILDGELVRSEPRAVTEVAIREARLRLPGPLAGAWNPPVNEARTVGLAGALISLAVGGLAGAVVFLGLGRGEVGRIQARYGSAIVTVSGADLREGQVVRVASMPDLVRLAERQGQVILHQALPSGDHRYFIPMDGVVYEYVLPARED